MSAEVEFQTLWVLMRRLDRLFDGNEGRDGVSQLQHSLQCAHAARQAAAPDVDIALALLHDVGKALNCAHHPALGAELLRGRLPALHIEVLRHHGEFQADHVHEREDTLTYIGEPWYPLAQDLAEWDSKAFQPNEVVPGLTCYLGIVRSLYGLPASL